MKALTILLNLILLTACLPKGDLFVTGTDDPLTDIVLVSSHRYDSRYFGSDYYYLTALSKSTGIAVYTIRVILDTRSIVSWYKIAYIDSSGEQHHLKLKEADLSWDSDKKRWAWQGYAIITETILRDFAADQPPDLYAYSHTIAGRSLISLDPEEARIQIAKIEEIAGQYLKQQP